MKLNNGVRLMEKDKSASTLSSLMLLLGAGASIYSGVPTGVPLVDKIVKDYQISNEFYEGLRKHFRKQKFDPDFEDFLIFLDLMNQLQVDVLLSMVGEIWPKDNKSFPMIQNHSKFLRRELLKGVREVCLNFDINKALKQYKFFFELDERITLQIFTTNYDPIIEEVLNKMKKDYSTNFKESRLGRKTVFYWDSTCEALNKTKIQVAKLHGSVYWYQDEITKDVEEIFQPTTRSSERHSVTHLMITPTVFKDVYQQPYYALYDRFQETLKKSRLLVIVGHSLRDEWLYGAITEHLDKNGLVVYVGIKRPVDLSEKIKKIERYAGFIYFPMSSEQFLPILSQLIRESQCQLDTLEEKLRKSAKNALDILEKKRSVSLKVPSGELYPNKELKVQVQFKGALVRGFYRLSLLGEGENVIITKDILRDKSGLGMLTGYSKRSRTITMTFPATVAKPTNTVKFRFEVVDQPSPGGEEAQTIVITKETERNINWEKKV
jgi:hypothetical protein